MNGNLKSLLFGKRLIIIVGILLTLVAAPLGILTMRQYMDAEATTETVDYETLKELIEPNRDKDPVKLGDNDKLTIPTDPTDGIVYQLESLHLDTTTGRFSTVAEGEVRLSLPVMDAHDDKAVLGENDMAIYRGTDYDLAMDATDTGFASYIVVLNENAPTDYEFEVELPTGYKLSEDDSNGIEILSPDNDVVGIMSAPWAVDANGDQIDTVYKLRGDSLVQTLTHSGAAYPVVADPEVEIHWTYIARVYFPGSAADWHDEIDDAGDYVDSWTVTVCWSSATIAAINAAVAAFFAPNTPNAVISAIIATFYCGATSLTAIQANDALEEIEDDFLSDPLEADCKIEIQTAYIGSYFKRVRLLDCGVTYSRFIAHGL